MTKFKLLLTTILTFGLSISAFAQLLPEEQEKPLLTLACLSDMHTERDMITQESLSNIYLRGSLIQTLNRIKEEEKIDILILGGDQTSDATIDQSHWKKTRALIAETVKTAFPEGATKFPVLYVSGNHEYECANWDNIPKPYNAADYYTVPMKQDIGPLTASESFYEMADNGDLGQMKLLAAYHYEINGFDFVVLNTGKYFFKSATDYQFSIESVQWVAKKLKQLYADDPNRTVFFLTHLPFRDSNSIRAADKGLKDCESSTLLKTTLAKYPNLIMLYGHDHGEDKSYSREKTSQRITRYNLQGDKINTTDANHVDGPVIPNPEQIVYEPQYFYVKSNTTGQYLGTDAENLATNDVKTTITFQLQDPEDLRYSVFVNPTVEGGPSNYLVSSSGGRFSCNEEIHPTYIYKVTRTDGPIEGERCDSLVSGETYIIVAQNMKETEKYYALTSTHYSEGARMLGEQVAISKNKVVLAASKKSVLWTFETSDERLNPAGPDIVEIPQSQGIDIDPDFQHATLVEGEEYNTYTCTQDYQIAIKMLNVNVETYDYILIKFAEPVAAGWNVAFWGDRSTRAIPAGTTEYRFDLEPSMATTLPELTLMTMVGGYTAPLTAKVVGLYKCRNEQPVISDFYIKSIKTGQYLGLDQYNLSNTLSPTAATVKLVNKDEKTFSVFINGECEEATGNYIVSSSGGRFSCNSEIHPTYLFEVQETNEENITAVKTDEIVEGHQYIIVAQNMKDASTYYALTCDHYSGGNRMNGYQVTISGDGVITVGASNTNILWSFEAVEQIDEFQNQYIFAVSNKTGQYLGVDTQNLACTDYQQKLILNLEKQSTSQFSLAVTRTCGEATGSYLVSSSGGRFSCNSNVFPLYLYKVEDPSASTIVATKCAALEDGGTYLIVALNMKDSTNYYALTCDHYTGGNRMLGEQVTISNGTITIDGSKQNLLWTINFTDDTDISNNHVDEDGSFFSAFMGSMRHYYNTIDPGDMPLGTPNIIQAMMVYVYKDRVVMQMKNYNKWGTINGITVNQYLASYTSYREVNPRETLADSISIDSITANIVVGQTYQLKATILPENATNDSIVWVSSDETVATVDSTGLVTAITPGTVTISATTTDGTELKAEITFEVLLHEYATEDVNRDDYVNSLDVLKIYKFMQTSTGSEEGVIEDVNADGKVNSLDVLKVYKYMQTH